MNNPNYGMKYYSDLEKIVHAAHMQDIWTAGGLAYKKFQESEAFHDESICPCITDVENNGILEWLKEITLKLRFGEHSGDHKLEDKIDDKPGNKYHFQQDHFHNWKDGKTLPKLQFGEHNLEDKPGDKYNQEHHFHNWRDDKTLPRLQFGEQNVEDKPGDKYNFQQDHFHNWKDGKTLPRLQFGEHNLGDDEEPLPNIKSFEAWKEWKDDILDFNLNVDKFGKMLGMYMHCL